MPKRKRQAKKRLRGDARLKDARRWLDSGDAGGKPLVEAYAARYAVSETVAQDELTAVGYYDEICIQEYERDGIEWECMVEPLSGDMFVVPKGIQEHQIYEMHGLL